MSNHYEDAESTALWSLAQMNKILKDYLIHIPNGGKRNPREAKRMKGMGVRRGVHDYHLPVARGIYHSLWVELKPDVKGYNPIATHEQVNWRRIMRKQGNAAFIIRGWMPVYDVMIDYLALKPGESLEIAPDHVFESTGYDNDRT